MLSDEDNIRLDNILEMIANMAALDFFKVLATSSKHDMLDAISLGLNMLSEELNSQVVAKEQLDEVNKKLEKFAYTTAHDLKSPLNTQTGLLFLLENSLEESNTEEARVFIQKLKNVNEDMKGLVKGILEYSLKNAQEIEVAPVDFSKLLSEVLKTDDIENKAHVIIKNSLPCVQFNKTAGIQIIRNLLDNAIKYCDKPRCEITIESIDQGNYHEVTFADNGPGIALEHQDKIFTLFNKIDPILKTDSSGIGLSTVKSIINSFGGEIWLNSVPGKGAAFIFTLKK